MLSSADCHSLESREVELFPFGVRIGKLEKVQSKADSKQKPTCLCILAAILEKDLP